MTMLYNFNASLLRAVGDTAARWSVWRWQVPSMWC